MVMGRGTGTGWTLTTHWLVTHAYSIHACCLTPHPPPVNDSDTNSGQQRENVTMNPKPSLTPQQWHPLHLPPSHSLIMHRCRQMITVMPPPDDNEGMEGWPWWWQDDDNTLSLSLSSHLPTTHGCGQTAMVTPLPDDDDDDVGEGWRGCGGWTMRMRVWGDGHNEDKIMRTMPSPSPSPPIHL